MATSEDVRRILAPLPRSYEVLVRDRIKYRIGSIVYAALSHDESVLGFAFPREERDNLVASDPVKFQLPRESDLRYNWVHLQLAEVDLDELTELLLDAWRMCVPKRVARDYLG